MIDEKVGPYLIRELINEGGTAALYAAKGPADETVALRILLPTHRFNWTQRRMFLRGRRILARFNSEWIVKLLNTGSYSFCPYSVMEFVPGQNLRFVLLKNPEEFSQHKISIILSMAYAICEVHKRGYVHLDIKPENFLVTPYWKVKLTDFDLCEKIGWRLMTRKKNLQGTPRYLAPELIRGQNFDQRADVFSFGIICYELLTNGKRPAGEVPNHSPDFEREIRPLTDFVQDVPKSLEKIVFKCLASNINDRYHSIWTMIPALEKEMEAQAARTTARLRVRQ